MACYNMRPTLSSQAPNRVVGSETQFRLFPLSEVLGIPMSEVLGIPKTKSQYVVIVGRDVLRYFKLTYDGITGAVSLEMPTSTR